MFIDEFKYKIINNTNILILHLFEAYEFLQKYIFQLSSIYLLPLVSGMVAIATAIFLSSS